MKEDVFSRAVGRKAGRSSWVFRLLGTLLPVWYQVLVDGCGDKRDEWGILIKGEGYMDKHVRFIFSKRVFDVLQ
jgi:hypothetical protein